MLLRALNATINAGQLTVTSINTGILSIDSGATITIAPISSGPTGMLSALDDVVAPPQAIVADITPPVLPSGSAQTRLTASAFDHFQLPSPINSRIDLAAMLTAVENSFENTLSEKQANKAKTAVFASLQDESLLRTGVIKKRSYSPAANKWSAHREPCRQ